MTRPKVRLHTRVRCNLQKGIHKLGCEGHERRHSRRSRSEAAQEREARKRAERRSLGQLQRYGKHNVLGPHFEPDEVQVAEAVNEYQSSTAERRLGPLASLTGAGIAIGIQERQWRAYRMVSLPGGRRSAPHTRRDWYGPVHPSAREAIDATRQATV